MFNPDINLVSVVDQANTCGETVLKISLSVNLL